MTTGWRAKRAPARQGSTAGPAARLRAMVPADLADVSRLSTNCSPMTRGRRRCSPTRSPSRRSSRLYLLAEADSERPTADGRAGRALTAGYAGMMFVPGGAQADVLTIAVRARSTGAGESARRCSARCSRPRGTAAAPRSSSRSGRTTRGPRGLYLRRGFEEIGVRRGYYQPSGVGRDRDAEGPATVSGPLVLGIETSCDETGVGIVRGLRAARRRGGVVDGPARPVRRRGPRGGEPGAPGGHGAGARGRVRQGGRASRPTSTRSR